MSGFKRKAVGRIQSAASYAVTYSFGDRDRFTCDHGLVDIRLTFGNQTIGRDFFTGPHQNQIARLDPLDINIVQLAVE